MKKTIGYKIIKDWLFTQKKEPFSFQEQTWQKILLGEPGLVNAPTGYGKTFSVFLGAIIQFINSHPDDYFTKKNNGLQLVWITPLRALGKDIARAMQAVVNELEIPWNIGIRNGDTPLSERQKQKRNLPEVLIITPESLHLLLAQKDYPQIFKQLKIIAVDEWHELLGSKRGVQVELALSRIVGLKKNNAQSNNENSKSKFPVAIWGISATIGNLEEAKDVLLAPLFSNNETGSTSPGNIISANYKKKIEIVSILPDEIEKYPWAGHLGIKLSRKILPIIHQNNSTLIFINTRGMSERWYQELLNIDPELAGNIALHHGSIEQELRLWVEDALHEGTLAAVVCTSSLDLGVDFRPVETVIQVGSPKGVARFLQRAGRSGHQPGASSRIWFLPTHSLELLEAAALKEAIAISLIESSSSYALMCCYNMFVRSQFLMDFILMKFLKK